MQTVDAAERIQLLPRVESGSIAGTVSVEKRVADERIQLSLYPMGMI
jgi:hypothetical protein